LALFGLLSISLRQDICVKNQYVNSVCRMTQLSQLEHSTIADVIGDTLTLELPNKFIADRVRTDFEPALLACCTALLPTSRL
jgi:hypothetical protein